MNITKIAFNQGIADWLRYHIHCPKYWVGTPEEKTWKRGYRYAARWNK